MKERYVWSGIIRDLYTDDFLAAHGARHGKLGLIEGAHQPMAMQLYRYEGDVVVYALRDVIYHQATREQVEELERVLKWCIEGMRPLTTSEAIEAAERRRCDWRYRPYPQWLRHEEGFKLWQPRSQTTSDRPTRAT